MAEYTKTVEIMEGDYFAQMPPKLVLEHCLSVTLIDIFRDGLTKQAIYDACGAVWMISHMRFTQTAPIREGDELVFHTHPRVEERARYIYEAEITRGEEELVRFECSYIPVDKAARKVVRLTSLAPLWKSPARETETPSTLRRLRPECTFTPCGSDTVRLSDCDGNRHMTSGAYLSLACNALGFWESDSPRYMKMMQLDYISEVYPGTLLHFERGEAEGIRYVRGLKPDGTVAFTAACDF